MDSVYGGFVSPIFPDKSYVFLPIPNVRDWGYQLDQTCKGLKTYSEIKTNSGTPLTDYLPKDEIKVMKKTIKEPSNIKVHNDPEFVTNTYGEKKEKKVIYNKVKDFKEGDYILFYATFFLCPYDLKYKDYTLKELQKIQQGKKQFYICAFLKLKYPPIHKNNYREYEHEIKNNAHYLRGDFDRHNKSFILKGTEDSGWIKPIRIDDGQRNKGNYYMKSEIAKYKLKNQHNRGLNRCYCELDESIIALINENKF